MKGYLKDLDDRVREATKEAVTRVVINGISLMVYGVKLVFDVEERIRNYARRFYRPQESGAKIEPGRRYPR